jgi:hypothetical protein
MWQAWHHGLCALPAPIIAALLASFARSIMPTPSVILRHGDARQGPKAIGQWAVLS